MKDKIELRVVFPPTRHDLTFWVPLDLTASQAAGLISSLLSKKNPALWETTGNEDLIICNTYDPADGRVLNPNESIRALYLQGILANGTRVALT